MRNLDQINSVLVKSGPNSINSREAVSLPPMIMLETKTVARKTSDPTMKATREKKTAPLKVPNTRNPSAPANHWKEESLGLAFSRQIICIYQGLLTPKDGPFPGIYVTLVSGPPTTTTTTTITIKCLISQLCFELDQI